MDKRYYEGLGRRKRAIARVRITAGKGATIVNNVLFAAYFPNAQSIESALRPLKTASLLEKIDISAKVSGGGKIAQADAIRMGLSRALVTMDPALKTTLSKLGLLKRDPREKERKKYGLKKARKASQFTKR